MLGRHLMVELYGCRAPILNDLDGLRGVLIEVARAAGATIVNSTFHRFAPQGVSGVLVIAESHLSIHTWPEYECALIDLFSCSPKVDLEFVCAELEDRLEASSAEARILERGRLPAAAASSHLPIACVRSRADADPADSGSNGS